jgi:superfamily I DNA/RNA helicase
MKDVKDGDMVLCRVTAPLAKLCMKYIANGTKAYIRGKDVGMNLINMLDKTKKTNIEEAIKVLYKELEKIARRVSVRQCCELSEATFSSQYVTYFDKINAMETLSEGLSQTRQLVSRIESIFKDDANQGICLSSVHKSKGLEADRVFIVCQEAFYNKRSMSISWMAQQEANLVYVAYTRAKHHLGFITDFM